MNPEPDKPLVTDLDGTLIHTDLLAETGNEFIVKHPLRVFKLLVWLLRGRAVLKQRLAALSQLDVSTLPYNHALLAWLKEERTKNRAVVLATASDASLAAKVAKHLGVFDRVVASQDGINLKSERKRDQLVAMYGEKGFDYVGNESADFHVWQAADVAHVVSPSRQFVEHVRSSFSLGRQFSETPRSDWTAWFKALRPHQWLKNLLIFVPLFAAHGYGSLDKLAHALLAFAAFSIVASSAYVLNDLVDVASDRHHARKRTRPFASGRLSLMQGWMAWPMLLVAGFALAAAALPAPFCAALGVYFLITVAYSLWIKQIAVLDVLVLAGLYTLRVVAGAKAVEVPMSFWLAAFCIFMFLSLALVKRFSELKTARDAGQDGAIKGRGYSADDLEMVTSLGAASGYIAVLVLALYIQDGSTIALYQTPQIIWLACPLLLYWISRTWLIAHRGQMHDDPVVFALQDRASLAVAGLVVAIFALARMPL